MFRSVSLLCWCFIVLSFAFTSTAFCQVTPTSGNACNGTYTGLFNGNVNVAAGQICRFTNGGITGNVTISGGTLNLAGASVGGDIQLRGVGNIILTRTTASGNIQVTNGGMLSLRLVSLNGNLEIHGIPIGSAINVICGTIIKGNLQFHDNGTAAQIGAAANCPGNTIGGNLEVQNNSGPTTLFNNTVTGDMHDQNNNSPTVLVGNIVGGNLQVLNNATSTVAFNSVQGTLQCSNDVVIMGGSNTSIQNQGCPTFLAAAGFASSTSGTLSFKSPQGATVLTIPLVNQQVQTTTPQGTITNQVQQKANVSDDGSHAGVYTKSFPVSTADSDTEAFLTATFTYYDATGQLWQIAAPLGDAFYFPPTGSFRLLTPDGSRILLVSAQDGNVNPVFSVYDQTGSLLFTSSGVFDEVYQAQISPNGEYVLGIGISESNNILQTIVWAININTHVSSLLAVNLTGGYPIVSTASDGRFLISFQGSQFVLPSN